MKKNSLALLLVATFFQTALSNATEISKSRTHESLLTHSKRALENGYYQVKQVKIRELTDEEELKYINEEELVMPELVLKDFIGNVPGGIVPTIPPIPPIPPQAGTTPTGGIIPSSPTTPSIPAPQGVLGGIIAIIDQLVAIGAKIMPTIEKGRSVVSHNPMSSVSVLPRLDTKDPVVHEMGNWSIPVSKHYKISYKNGFGSEVVTFVFGLTFQHSGTYNNKGHYLTGIRMSARDISVNWGYDLDATSQLLSISNVGTSDNVIAGATLEISYTVKNWTRTLTTSKSFHVTGDGRIFQLD
jgi:hypothetical protein